MYAVVCPRSEVQYDEDSFKQRVIELKRQRLKVSAFGLCQSVGYRGEGDKEGEGAQWEGG